jgi:hypothetical protein
MGSKGLYEKKREPDGLANQLPLRVKPYEQPSCPFRREGATILGGPEATAAKGFGF